MALKCPNCKEVIRKPIIEPSHVRVPSSTVYEYICPLCRIPLLYDPNGSLSKEDIKRRIKEEWPSQSRVLVADRQGSIVRDDPDE
jgi:hypothetical protein